MNDMQRRMLLPAVSTLRSHRGAQTGVAQLFDLVRDPWETRNLADRKESATLKRELLGRLRRFQEELDDDLPPATVAD